MFSWRKSSASFAVWRSNCPKRSAGRPARRVAEVAVLEGLPAGLHLREEVRHVGEEFLLDRGVVGVTGHRHVELLAGLADDALDLAPVPEPALERGGVGELPPLQLVQQRGDGLPGGPVAGRGDVAQRVGGKGHGDPP
jgi:hypothetical protein